jgi:hypothetical protein
VLGNCQAIIERSGLDKGSFHIRSGWRSPDKLEGYRSESAPLTVVGVPAAADYSLNVHSFLAGARVVGRRDDGLTAFLHVLAGATRVGLTLSAALVSGYRYLTGQQGGALPASR